MKNIPLDAKKGVFTTRFHSPVVRGCSQCVGVNIFTLQVGGLQASGWLKSSCKHLLQQSVWAESEPSSTVKGQVPQLEWICEAAQEVSHTAVYPPLSTCHLVQSAAEFSRWWLTRISTLDLTTRGVVNNVHFYSPLPLIPDLSYLQPALQQVEALSWPSG